MSDESRILDLLEEALNSGRTPEEVCAECPELLWEVRERLKRCKQVEAQIDAIFPTTGAAKKHARPLHLPTTLPRIPAEVPVFVIIEVALWMHARDVAIRDVDVRARNAHTRGRGRGEGRDQEPQDEARR